MRWGGLPSQGFRVRGGNFPSQGFDISNVLIAFYGILYVQNIKFFSIFPVGTDLQVSIFSGRGLQDFQRRVLT